MLRFIRERLSAVQPSLLVLAAMISALVAFVDKVETLSKSTLILYGIAAIDMFRFELVALALFVVFGPIVFRLIAIGVTAARAILSTRQMSDRESAEVVILSVAVLLVSLVCPVSQRC